MENDNNYLTQIEDTVINSLRDQISINTLINNTNDSNSNNSHTKEEESKLQLLKIIESQSQDEFISNQQQCREENDGLLKKIDFLQKQILKLSQEKKKQKEFFEKNIVNILKEKNEQIDALNKKNEELIEQISIIINIEDNNQKAKETLIAELNEKYLCIKDKLDKEIEIRKRIEMEYDQETRLLKEEISDLKAKTLSTKGLMHLMTPGKVLLDINKNELAYVNGIELKDGLMLEKAVSISFCPDEDIENYVERKDHIEEIRSVKEYYENIVNELKQTIIHLQGGNKTNDINNNEHSNDNESYINALVKQIILLKNDLAEMAFEKDSRIIQLKKQNMRLSNFFKSKFESKSKSKSMTK